jgi:trans-aconitate 2-methyltransferase
MPDAWNPEQYARFRDERSEPFWDLVSLLRFGPAQPGPLRPPPPTAAAATPPAAPPAKPGKGPAAGAALLRAIDLGCGDGVLTQELYGYLCIQLGAADAPAAVDLVGIDNSLKMIEACRTHADSLAVSTAASPDLRRMPPGVSSPRFALGDIVRFAEKALLGELPPYDLVFSNAALQWVPDHSRLLIGLTEAVARGGQLAVQLPSNQQHPSQRIARELAAMEPYAGALEGYGTTAPTTVLAPEDYAALLHRYGFTEQHVRLQVYGHVLPDAQDVVEWVRGTMLTAYQQRLSPALWERFLQDYRARIAAELGSGREYLLTYNRILFWGRKPG